MSKKILVERDIEIPMRDSVILRADVYRQDTNKQLPVLLQRTPYGKGFSRTSFALFVAEQGYAVVLQDTRGRWNSDGESYPFFHEVEDGYDTIQWVANQSWSNGSVGMFGESYHGYTQYSAAVTKHPALKTIIPAISFSDPRDFLYHNGALTLSSAISWSLLAGAHMAIMREPIVEAEKEPLWSQFIDTVDGMTLGKTFNHFPLENIPLIGQDGLITFFSDVIQHQNDEDFWRPTICSHQHITIPTLHIGGWYDCFIRCTLRDYLGIGSHGNKAQKMILGPWIHGSFDGLAGEVDFGLSAYAMILLPDEIQLRWFDHWLKGIDDGLMDEPPIRIFVMGENRWRDEYEWPLARTKYTRFYLHGDGQANSIHGDGTLSKVKPTLEPHDSFVYNPLNPVPTRGGGLCCWNTALPPGAYDQREVEARPDVLIYTTPPLEENIEVTGPIQVNLWASSSAPDTDFTAKLVDVSPCGFARNVQDGIIRARYREPGQETLIAPGEIYRYHIDLSVTSNVFKAGHAIRLEISSSNFPRFDRNPNTGAIRGESTDLRPALQTVHHEGQFPSHILLPIIPR